LHKPPLTEIGNHNSSIKKRQKQQQQKPLQRQELQHFWLELMLKERRSPLCNLWSKTNTMPEARQSVQDAAMAATSSTLEHSRKMLLLCY